MPSYTPKYKKIGNTSIIEDAGRRLNLTEFTRNYGHLFDDVEKGYTDFMGTLTKKQTKPKEPKE